MSGAALERVFREASGRIVGALAARFRDLSLAEDSYSEACARALEDWPEAAVPDDPAAWLYRVASRIALDVIRHNKTHQRFAPIIAQTEETADIEETSDVIPDERLRLIFICCHPAVSIDARAALTLRLVCGLSTQEIARAFLLPDTTLAQRLTRAKQKIADAGIPFEVPGPEHWPERLDAVLSTLEVTYARAHEDAAGTSVHAHYAAEVLHLSHVVAQLMPNEPDALAMAALVRFSEARRPARVDANGLMVQLSEQDPALWNRPLIEAGTAFLDRAVRIDSNLPRVIQAQIHGCWCRRLTRSDAAPWSDVLALYDRWLALQENPIVRLNRAVALAEVKGPSAALADLEQLDGAQLRSYAPYHAVRAEMLSRTGQFSAAISAYDAAIALVSTRAEGAWLSNRRDTLASLARTR
jgi:RNA polymerase sigma-70 factor (ECF subfamily)